MAKFRIRLKVQALEVEIDGEREDIPAISGALGRQLANIVQPAAALTNGSDPADKTIDAEIDEGKQKKPTGRRRSGSKSGEGPAQPIDFRHQPEKYGNPKQTWSVGEKAIWLLAVLKGIQNLNEVSGPQIAATFNDKFKQSGRVHPPNVTRDLGLLKVQNPAPVGQDKDLWYLTDEGDRQAKELIASVLAPV